MTNEVKGQVMQTIATLLLCLWVDCCFGME